MARHFWMLALLVAALASFGCQSARAKFLASEAETVLPQAPNGEPRKIEVDPRYCDAELKVTFQCNAPPAQVLALMLHELESRGFKVEAGQEAGDRLPDPTTVRAPLQDRTEVREPMYHANRFVRGDPIIWGDRVYLSVRWDGTATDHCEVFMQLRHYSLLGELAKMPVVVPVGIVFLPRTLVDEGGMGYGVTERIINCLY